jgi:hypothetical protein
MTETSLTIDRDRLPPEGFIPMLSVKQPSRVRIRVQYSGVVFPGTLDVFVGIGPRGSERDVLHFTETGERPIPEIVGAGEWISVRYSPLPDGGAFTIWPSSVETVP